MKLVIAIIQPDKLDEVREALAAKDIHRITVSRVSGHGEERQADLYRGEQVPQDLTPKARLEIACNDNYVDACVETITESARHGQGEHGDGVILILPVEECVRIRTGERGNIAIG